MTPDSYTVLHALSGRLSLRISSLVEPGFTEPLRYWPETHEGFGDVIINRPAGSLFVHYDPRVRTEVGLLARIHAFALRCDAMRLPEQRHEPPIAPLVRSVLTLVLLPFLPRAAQHVATLLNIGAKLVKGADTLLREGAKVDALAVGRSASRGKLSTANITDLFLRSCASIRPSWRARSWAGYCPWAVRSCITPPPTAFW